MRPRHRKGMRMSQETTRSSLWSQLGAVAMFLLTVVYLVMIGQSHVRAEEITVRIDEQPLQFDAEPFLENGRVMVPMRGIFEHFDALVYWDGESKTVRAFARGEVLTLQVGKTKFDHNGELFDMDTAPVIRSGRTFVPVRFIAQSLGMDVAWDADNQRVEISKKSESDTSPATEPTPGNDAPKPTDEPATNAPEVPANEHETIDPIAQYSEEEIELLTRVINAEAYSEPFEGKVAVGAVIMNRVKSSAFPNTITAVIYQPNQFYVVSNGAIHRSLAPDSREAALEALRGNDPTDGALFFWNPNRSESPFVSKLQTNVVIGGHAFGK